MSEIKIHVLHCGQVRTTRWLPFNIQRVRGSEFFEPRLTKLIEACEKGQMIGDWNDYGRLLDY